MINIFQHGHFTLHSGSRSAFKIECDALTDDDWKSLAFIISKRIKFREVHGIPKGGLHLEYHLSQYSTHNELDPYLIVDDVLTTGNSMIQKRNELNSDNVIGLVVFSRDNCPSWITPIFKIGSDWM
jgi:orotate phosphoribosyltransferase